MEYGLFTDKYLHLSGHRCQEERDNPIHLVNKEHRSLVRKGPDIEDI